jgi:hypothetical protein
MHGIYFCSIFLLPDSKRPILVFSTTPSRWRQIANSDDVGWSDRRDEISTPGAMTVRISWQSGTTLMRFHSVWRRHSSVECQDPRSALEKDSSKCNTLAVDYRRFNSSTTLVDRARIWNLKEEESSFPIDLWKPSHTYTIMATAIMGRGVPPMCGYGCWWKVGNPSSGTNHLLRKMRGTKDSHDNISVAL